MNTKSNQQTITLQLEAGTHWVCTCGYSQNLPYCNGAHKGTEFQPLALELDAPQTVETSDIRSK